METGTSYILSTFDKINGFVKGVSTKQWIIMYSVIAISCALYLAWFRIKKIKEQELYIKSSKNTKRAKAIDTFKNYSKNIVNNKKIEKFQNFDNQLATELAQHCDAELESNPPTLPTRDSLFINKNFESSFMTQLSPDTQADYTNGKQILENFLFIIDSKITEYVQKTKATYDSILNVTIRNNQFVQENKLDVELDALPKQIKELEVSLDGELKTTLPADQSGLLRTLNTEENAYKSLNFEIEVKERLFELVSYDKRVLFRNICSIKGQMKTLQAKIDSLNPNLSQESYLNANKELDALRLSLADLDAKYKSAILILSRLATSTQTQELLKRESAEMSTVLIQPANETQIDAMALLKQKLHTYADPGSVGNPVLGKAVEIDLTQKYSGAYQDYIDSMEQYSLNAKVDPIKIASSIEEKTLDFLTELNSRLRGDSADSNKSTFSSVNRFGTQSNNLGTWLVGGIATKKRERSNIKKGDPIPATDIEKLAKYVDSKGKEGFQDTRVKPAYRGKEGFQDTRGKEGFQDTRGKEGFQDTPTTTASSPVEEATGYLATAESFIKYAYDYILGFMDDDTAEKLESLLTAEDNMIPIGVVLIFISIILFLASSGSSDSK